MPHSSPMVADPAWVTLISVGETLNATGVSSTAKELAAEADSSPTTTPGCIAVEIDVVALAAGTTDDMVIETYTCPGANASLVNTLPKDTRTLGVSAGAWTIIRETFMLDWETLCSGFLVKAKMTGSTDLGSVVVRMRRYWWRR